ncbi:MAG TPA: hypothetical protein EYQ81_12870 [Sneathiellales bacterium]|nr:hypothetical protein [Sneathiellales bacterium]
MATIWIDGIWLYEAKLHEKYPYPSEAAEVPDNGSFLVMSGKQLKHRFKKATNIQDSKMYQVRRTPNGQVTACAGPDGTCIAMAAASFCDKAI